MNILVVEDERPLRNTAVAALTSSGHKVVGAESGIEALERVADGRPDLVLLDLQLPELDGREFLRRFRSQPACADIPVVVMSAEHGVARSALGAQAFFEKPFDLDELLDRIEELLLTDASVAGNDGSRRARTY